jgi:hypothetical protein
MTETEEIQNLRILIEGLKSKIKEKETDRDKFQRAAGLDELSEKARAEISEIEVDIQSLKEEIAEKKGEKSRSLNKTIIALVGKMNETLPTGSAAITIENGVSIGWHKDGALRPYHALSGAEQKTLDGALSKAFKTNILIYDNDAADKKTVFEMLKILIDQDEQIIFTTHHYDIENSEVPKGWEIIRL